MRFSVKPALFSCFSVLAGSLFLARAAHAALPVIPNDPLFAKQWDLRQIHAPEAWGVTTGSPDVTVAVIDSGVDFSHPDLSGILVSHGWNFVTNSTDTRPMTGSYQPDDALSHGTIMVSLLAATGNDGIGMAGVAWNIRVMPLVVLDMNGSGSVAHIRDAIRYAVKHGADIISISVVGYEQDDDLDRVIKEAADAGVLVVAAAGNTDGWKNGEDLDITPMYPACSLAGSAALLAVSATDALDQKAPYANFGHTCVGISAPGHELLAASASTTRYVSDVTGTSAAVPLVSGAAALIKSVRPDWSAAQIRARLVATADPIDQVQKPDVREKLGSGRLNIGRAVRGIAPASSASHPVALFTFMQNLLSVFVP